jgi:hypothetical protein
VGQAILSPVGRHGYNPYVSIEIDDGVKTGSHPPYRWLMSPGQYMGTLVRLCPEVVLGRHLAVTCLASGDPQPTDKQIVANWQTRSGIVYSPRLASTDELFYQRDGLDSPGYDEWYLLEAAADLGELITREENPFEPAHAPQPRRLMVFVNYPAFVLDDPSETVFADMFWKQLEWIKPESYVADGRDYLTFVTTNGPLFDIVCERLNAALAG